MSPLKDVTSVAPALLLSMPQLDDPNFRHTVVLLCQHSAEGAWGLILNRPTGTPAVQAVKMEPPVKAANSLDLWVGGPVEPERGCILMGDDPEDEEAVEVCRGIYISGSASLLRRLMEDEQAPARTRLLMGYAGWGPGQLDAELRDSAWLISDVDLGLVFDVDAPLMWEKAIRRLGADPGSLQMSQGVH
ncbi:MAG TPA: YqgE/AlgH family protein [Vicinamibacterales bacterium]|nr:YqgE/AlgH family protein [Acidobacteriota bacterium]HOC18356.1 YqgE/AlgH family protein [Vicinamibacterales bacterium]